MCSILSSVLQTLIIFVIDLFKYKMVIRSRREKVRKGFRKILPGQFSLNTGVRKKVEIHLKLNFTVSLQKYSFH